MECSETGILIFSRDGLKNVKRRKREELHHDCPPAIVKIPFSFTWSCMPVDSTGHLLVIDGTFIARKCTDTILEPKLSPSVRDLFPNNVSLFSSAASGHTAKLLKVWSHTKSTGLFSWAGNSSDLNLIEDL
ncbi:transposable element Tcb1 transposase [Trichonephila clavipes]|nr:transposable element Tcb1 transposase [Trichonephila clavipes]